jgi:hypothetical protein
MWMNVTGAPYRVAPVIVSVPTPGDMIGFAVRGDEPREQQRWASRTLERPIVQDYRDFMRLYFWQDAMNIAFGLFVVGNDKFGGKC